MISVTQFLNERMESVLKTEKDNESLVHLYHVNGCWSAVEKSAYFLSRFAGCQVITLLSKDHDGGPDSQIVLASTSETQLADASQAYSVISDDGDHLILRPRNIPAHYSEWHQENILQDPEDDDYDA